MFYLVVSSAARAVGDAAGVQVPRDVGLVHGEDLLDAAAELPLCGRRVEGPLRRRVAGHDAERWPGGACAAERRGAAQGAAPRPLPIPAAAAQPRPQVAGQQGPGVPRVVARVLREESAARHPRHARARLQRHQHRRRRVRPHVLRPRLPDWDYVRGGTVQLHLPLVLRGEMQKLSHGKSGSHMFIGGRTLTP